jgi:hypothetical protein
VVVASERRHLSAVPKGVRRIFRPSWWLQLLEAKTSFFQWNPRSNLGLQIPARNPWTSRSTQSANNVVFSFSMLPFLWVGTILDHVQQSELRLQKTEKPMLQSSSAFGRVGAKADALTRDALCSSFTTFYVFLPRFHTRELTLR